MSPELYDFSPDYGFQPGDFVADVIDRLGMSQAELARRTGLSVKHVNQICQGASTISADTAVLLERATGVDIRIWLRLEAEFQAERGRRDEDSRLEVQTDWLNNFPVSELKKRKWISGNAKGVDQLREVLQFFRVAAPSAWEQVWATPTAYRVSQAFAPDMAALATWIRIGERRSEALALRPYDRERFRSSLDAIRSLVALDDPAVWQPQLESLFAQAGVALIIEKEIKGARINGLVRWLPGGNPMLMLSARHRWADIFWFTLFHEVGHLIVHDRRRLTFVDSPGDQPANRLVEQEADDFASRLLIPREYDQLVYSARTGADVQAIARQVGVHPGIIVGRLQHDHIIRFSQLNDLRVRLMFADD